jgi:hypothetical protein
LPQKVGLAVEEAEEAADVAIYGLRCHLRQFAQELSYILDSNCFVGRVSVKYLLSQVPNDLACDLRALPANTQRNELSHRCRQVILIVK